MPKNKNLWWRDPKFIIPSIFIPIFVAIIGLLPSFRSDKISDKLSVILSMSDPRRSDSGLFDIRIMKTFAIDEKSESEAAKNIAKSLAKDILSNQPALQSDRKKIRVLVRLADDGTLFINEPWNKTVALHLSRFTDYGDIDSLALAAANFRIGPQSTLDEPYLPTEYFTGEISVLERKTRAGVYRVVLTAPGYRDQSIYLQLSEKGKVFTASDFNEVVELEFPIPVDLFPRFKESSQPAPLRVAIGHCTVTPSASSKPKFQNMGVAIQTELVAAFRQEGVNPFILKEGQKVGFDLNPSKGLPPTEGLVPTDLVIEQFRCEWMK